MYIDHNYTYEPERETFEDVGRGTQVRTWASGVHPALMLGSWLPSAEGVLMAPPLGFVTGQAGW